GEQRTVRASLLGRWANAGALVAAAYFIARDTYMSFHPGPSGLNAFDVPDMWGFAALGHGVRAAMLVVWHLEWVIYGYLLWLQVAGLVAITRALRRTDFAPHLVRILVRDDYRDFFTLLGKTATVSMVFALGNLLFVHLTGELFPRQVVHIDGLGDFLEQMSDVLSISVLFVVVTFGVFVHMHMLRRALSRTVDASLGAAGDAAIELIAAPVPATGDPAADAAHLRAHVEAQSVLLRAVTFHREIDQLGGRTMSSVLAQAEPASTGAAHRLATMQLSAPCCRSRC